MKNDKNRDFYISKISPNNEHENSSVQWHQDGKTFETIKEAHEWAYSVIYNEIGKLYDGYKTADEKIAYSLVYELVRANTLYGHSFNIHTDLEKEAPNSYIYKVWVTSLDKK